MKKSVPLPCLIACLVSLALHGLAMDLYVQLNRSSTFHANLGISKNPLRVMNTRIYSPDLSQGGGSKSAQSVPRADTDQRGETVAVRVEPVTMELDHFVEAELLSSIATPRELVNLDIPEASSLTAPGKIVIKLWIDASGKVVKTQVESSDFPESYANAVADIFRSTTFSPGQLNGQAVHSILRVETLYE